MSQRIFKILENRLPEGPSVRHLLPALAKVIGLAPGTLLEGTGHFQKALAPSPRRPWSRVRWEEVELSGEACGPPQVVPLVWGSLEPRFLLSKLSISWESGSLPFPTCAPSSPCRPDQPAQQKAGGLAALRQHPARPSIFRGLLLHAQDPAGEAQVPRDPREQKSQLRHMLGMWLTPNVRGLKPQNHIEQGWWSAQESQNPGEPGLHSHPLLRSKFEDRLMYMRPSHKTKTAGVPPPVALALSATWTAHIASLTRRLPVDTACPSSWFC